MNAQGEFEAKVATITAWVTDTKEKNEQLEKEVRRVTGELTHLQESVVKPMERVLVPLGLYEYQSYAECITATVAKLDRVTGERDALRATLAEIRAASAAIASGLAVGAGKAMLVPRLLGFY